MAAMLLLSMNLLAQLSTGKIEGVVRDKDTGQPLKGAQVKVEGTRLGNLTNEDGYYFILNVPPGSRDITFSYTGYQKTTLSNVSVLAGQTMTVNSTLSSTVVEMNGITVAAEAEPMVPRDNTATKRRLTAEKMQDIPSTVLEDMLVLEAGVQTGGGGAKARGLKLRGGRLGEEAMVVDGLMIRNYSANVEANGGGWHNNDEEGGYSEDATPLEVSVGAVEEVDILTGGFQAEYGNAQSGIINVVTREGGAQLSGAVRYTTDGQQPRTSDWGYNALNVNVGGPVPLINDLYFQVSGEVQGQEDRSRTHASEGFRGFNQEFVDRLNDAVRNDPYFGGTSPFTLEKLAAGQAAYGALTDGSKSLFLAPNPVRLPGDWQDRTSFSTKLTYSPFNGLKVLASDNWFRNQYAYPLGDGTNADGDYFRTNVFAKDDPLYQPVFANRDWKPGETTVSLPEHNGRRGRTNNAMAGFNWDLLRSAERNMSLQFRYGHNHFVEIPSSNFKTNWERDSFLGWAAHDIQFEGETWPEREKFTLTTNELKKQYYPDGVTDWLQNVPVRYPYLTLARATIYFLQYRYLRESQDNYKGDLDFQWNRKNRAKAGFTYTEISNLRFGYGAYSKTDPRGTWAYHPKVYSFYGQNRTDLGDLVIDYGIRYDAFDPVDNWGTSALDIGGSQVKVKVQHEFSPRFNIAFPVTDKAQLRFSYGVFTQMPSLDYIYGISSGGSDIRNRGDLGYSRTDAFEGGFTYLLAQDMSLDIVTYYRDVSGNVSSKPFYVDYYNDLKQTRYRQQVDGYSNQDNGNIKGLDVTLTKRFSQNYSLDLNYTMQFSRTTGSSVNAGFYNLIDPSTNETFIEPTELNPINGDRTHQIKARFNYMFPRDFQSGTLLGKVLRDFKASAVYEVLSGQPSNGSSLGGIVYGANYFRGKWYTNLDFRFDKTFRLGRSKRIGVFAEVFNALNRKNHVNYPSGYTYNGNYRAAGGDELVWATEADPFLKSRFAADFNADGILSYEEIAMGNMAYNMMNSTMNKTTYGVARQVRSGISLSF
jgi:hypothetical protein